MSKDIKETTTDALNYIQDHKDAICLIGIWTLITMHEIGYLIRSIKM